MQSSFFFDVNTNYINYLKNHLFGSGPTDPTIEIYPRGDIFPAFDEYGNRCECLGTLVLIRTWHKSRGELVETRFIGRDGTPRDKAFVNQHIEDIRTFLRREGIDPNRLRNLSGKFLFESSVELTE